jgi:hypothetical protein
MLSNALILYCDPLYTSEYFATKHILPFFVLHNQIHQSKHRMINVLLSVKILLIQPRPAGASQVEPQPSDPVPPSDIFRDIPRSTEFSLE